MTDLEISKALALAIGWSKYDVRTSTLTGNVLVFWQEAGVISKWILFDYRDWNVIGPIAEKFDCFPKFSKTQAWWANCPLSNGVYADTPQKAIALAVIGAKK
jgi:hypothetical protein